MVGRELWGNKFPENQPAESLGKVFKVQNAATKQVSKIHRLSQGHEQIVRPRASFPFTGVCIGTGFIGIVLSTV
jgi:hypothetical protein